MAFGKKKNAVASNVNQSNVVMHATEALKRLRATRVRLPVRLVATAPILMNRWTSEAVLQMLGTMTKQPIPRPPKDLTKEFERSWYRNVKGELALPTRLIKACIVNGAISTGGVVSKAELKRELRVCGFTSPLRDDDGQPAHVEMDVKIASNHGGGPDLRARGLVEHYHCDVVLEFPPSLTPDKVVAAFAAGGDTIGLANWRPERGGEYGTFSIEMLDNAEIPRIMRENALPEEEFKIPPELLHAFGAHMGESDMANKAVATVKHVNGQNKRRGRSTGTQSAAE